jgi:methyl-accepting chemotaxis protein
MSVDYMCEYGDITELRYEAHAAISPEAFFGISTNSFNVGVDSISLPVKAYLQIYSECNIQDAGLDAIKKIPVPGSETTLGELDSLVNAVNEMQSKLREIKEKVERTAGVVIRTQRGPVLEHQKRVTAYIELCGRELQGVSKALQTNNANAVESAIAHAVQRLGGQMEQLREVTNTLQDS